MGLWVSHLWEQFVKSFEGDPARILMLGLDAAGKTTVLYKIKLNENVVTIPTIGFNVETVNLGKGLHFTVWDVGGQEKLRPLWQHYYQNAKGLVYIVDSCDKQRFQEAKYELNCIMQHVEMQAVPIVVLANKQDMPGAVSSAELADALGLSAVKDRKWYVQGTCAISGEGIYEGMHQLGSMVKDFQRMKQSGYLS